jgi:hypothetical protein
MPPQSRRSHADTTDEYDANAQSLASVATATVAAPYFVTGPNVRAGRAAGGVAASISGGPYHAKTMGTPFTACGLPASSWTKLWDIPFASSPQPVCDRCFDVLNGPRDGVRPPDDVASSS